MYLVIEIQKQADGTCTHLVTQKAERNEAEAEYHRVLAAAAVSQLQAHSAVLISDMGVPLDHQCYEHGEMA